MCGIAGWTNFNENILYNKYIIENMTDTLKKRGPDEVGYYFSKHSLLGHRRLVVVDPEGGKQPMIKNIDGNKFIIVYNGELYNTEDLRKTLIKEGYSFDSYSDTEVLLTSYIHWGYKCLEYINGIYAFAILDEKNKSLFLGRDPLGVKPLFYTIRDNSLIFGSEIKTLLAHPKVKPILTKQGLTEIFGLGPSRAIGSGVFKDIYEIPPAHRGIFTPSGFTLEEYWNVTCEIHTETLNETADHVKSLLYDAVKRQLVADVPVGTFLSGGLDSSAISAIAAKEFKKEGKILDTYSIDYEDNEKYFEANEFQPNSDSVWALKMRDFIGSNHTGIINSNEALASALVDAVKANDLPGMADIDSSLYLFCKEVRKDKVVALSGECADEIFGGYPWFRREEDINANTFPWSKSVSERNKILSGDLNKLDLDSFVKEHYENTLKQVPHINGESKYASRMREMFYLNIKWFMLTLLTRKDRMSMSNSLEVRVPFADYRLVQYAFNIPPEMRFCDDREKGLLRRSLKGLLPEDIITRKKSPYPKTHNPKYTKIVQKWLKSILEDPSSPLLDLIDIPFVSEIVATGGASYTKPWYGQLMTGPQLMAYLIQIDTWLRLYNVEIEM
jgi:asparagine synthase (glutamine-hydrolysing)